MRFTSSVNVDFSKWTQVKMERENNMREFRGTEEEIPKSVLAAFYPSTAKYFLVW
jgi:hypothetical protein